MHPREGGLDAFEAEGPRQFLRRHEVFVRKTRDAAHQALYFLGVLEPTTSRHAQRAVDEYRSFGLHQVRSLVRGVHLRKTAYAEVEQRLASDPPPEEQREPLRRALAEYASWRKVFDDLERPNAAGADPRALRDALASYVRATGRGQSFIRAFFGLIHKNLALVWGAALLAGAALVVEAVNVLLRNEGWYLLVPLSLLLVPLILSRVRTRQSMRRNGGAVPSWDLAGPPFRSLQGQAREPGPLIERWPENTGLSEGVAFKLIGSLLVWLGLVGLVAYLVSTGSLTGRYILATVLVAGLVACVYAARRWLTGASLPWQIACGHLVKLTAYVVWWVAVVGIYVLLVRTGFLGESALTVFLILSIFYFVLLGAHVLDFWDFLDPRPVRFIVLVAAAIAVAFLIAGLGREFFVAAFAAGGLFYMIRFLRDWRRRSASMAVAAVLLLLSILVWVGRETHQRDEWTNDGETLVRLEAGEWPFDPGATEPVVVLAASGGGSRAAFYTALTLQHLHRDEPEVARRLEAISSVSGGSLASAAYVARRFQDDGNLGRIDAGEGEDAGRLLHNAVGRDFLFPTLKGALVPGTSRGREIQRTWDQGDVRLGGLTLGDLTAAWRQARQASASHPPFPVPLFNSTTLDAHAVVISPLERSFYTRPELREEALADLLLAEASDATWVHYRDGVYGLEDFLDKHDPPLSAAVRASANFPFGFPLVRLRDPIGPPFFSPGWRTWSEDVISLTDGGALSNSGMWTLTNLLLNQADELRDRGVLLLVVEASKMPTYGGVGRSFQRLWGMIGDQAPIAQNLHRRMLDLLEVRYGSRIAVVQLDLIPQESHNVLTTWALDRGSRRILEESFAERWRQERERLRASWQVLTGEAPAPGPYIARHRPPLD